MLARNQQAYEDKQRQNALAAAQRNAEAPQRAANQAAYDRKQADYQKQLEDARARGVQDAQEREQKAQRYEQKQQEAAQHRAEVEARQKEAARKAQEKAQKKARALKQARDAFASFDVPTETSSALGYDRHGIIANFESRVNHSRAEELRASLDQIYRIARFRLDDLIDA